ncbi:MAG: J domain-containing protein [archaeon]|nr:MAG: J domain-containing protein [archaeon]
MTGRDFYAVLGVAKTALVDEIKEAYRRLAAQYHPDRNRSPEAEERFKEVSEAYSVLSNSDKRTLYDALGPDKYDDPREVLLYRLNKEAVRREAKREDDAWRSTRRNDGAETTGVLLFFLLTFDFVIPPSVSGHWYFVFNGFILLCLAISVHEWVRL